MIKPYPENVRVNGFNFFDGPAFIGEVTIHENWASSFLARPVKGVEFNKFFPTKTKAGLYLVEIHRGVK